MYYGAFVTWPSIYGRESEAVVVPLTQEDIAGLAGTSRATVNRVLREEERRGTVELEAGQDHRSRS